ncbi:MAG: uracil-DNA glycosylase [Roseiflexus sp.]
MISLVQQQHCVRCPALVAGRRRIVHGYGDVRSGIVFIGEAPGRHGADQTGIPFWGDRSGRTLRRMLVRLGLADDETATASLRCFITNTVRCCPPGNRTPTAAEVQSCREWLQTELDALKPHLIVPMGRIALQEIVKRYLKGKSGVIRSLHATVLRSKEVTILPMVHPARIRRVDVEAFIAAMQPLINRRDGP